MSEEISGDSTAENVVESSTGALDLAGLTASIKASKQPQEEAPEIPVESEVAEESTEDEVVQEVSEVSEEVQEEIQEDVETEEELESEEEDTVDVLSKEKRAINKLTKRNKKLTKNWRTAEEKIEDLERQVEKLTSGESKPANSEQPKGFTQKVEAAESIEDLEEIFETAKSVKQTAKQLLRQMEDSGDVEIEHGDRTLTKDEIRDALDDAEEALESKISNKANMFQERKQYDEFAISNFDFLKDDESEYYEKAQQFMTDQGLSNFLKGRSDQLLVLGLLVEGQRSLDLKAKEKQSSKEKDKTEETPKKAASTFCVNPLGCSELAGLDSPLVNFST